MKKLRCIGCGERTHTIGALYDNPALTICGICRDMSLTFIYSCGIPMTAKHPLVNELVEGTPLAGRGFWRYYNSITREGEIVMGVVK